MVVAGQAATKLRHRTPEERRRGAGRSTRVQNPRQSSWIAYQSSTLIPSQNISRKKRIGRLGWSVPIVRKGCRKMK